VEDIKNNNMILRSFITYILASLLIPVTCFAQENIDAQVDSIIDYVAEDGAGTSVTIIKDNKVVTQKYYGYANVEDKEPVTAETRFNLGTLTKQFTAMSILILKQEEKLSFKDKISQYIDNLPEYTTDLKIENLIKENSGLPYLDIRDDQSKYNTPEAVVDFLNTKEELRFKTGRKAMANPVNEALLVLILEKVSGQDYRSFVTEKIFEPLNMENSEVYKGGFFYKIKDKAIGYQNVGTAQEPDFEKVDQVLEKPYMRGVTGIYSSTPDLIKWIEAWNSEKIVSRNLLSEVKRIQYVRNASEFLGFGWRRGFNKGQKYLYQGGIGYGNTHIFLTLPREKVTVIILNNQRAVFGLRKTAFKLLNLVSEKQYEIK
jgi:CubicO group peptidase (beta-lactamase class C family)